MTKSLAVTFERLLDFQKALGIMILYFLSHQRINVCQEVIFFSFKSSILHFIHINNTDLLGIYFFIFFYLIVKRKEMESYYDGKFTGSHRRVM